MTVDLVAETATYTPHNRTKGRDSMPSMGFERPLQQSAAADLPNRPHGHTDRRHFYYKKKVKQSHYRPGQSQRVLRKLKFPDFMTTAQDGGKVVSLTHRPPLPPGNTPGTHFC